MTEVHHGVSTHAHEHAPATGGAINYVFLSPHFPPPFVHFCRTLRDVNVNVLGIADDPYDNLKPELKSALTEYYRVGSLENYDDVFRAIGYFVHKYGRISFIESHNEHWLELEARLRTDFNVNTGYHIEEMLNNRKKSRMKEIFRKAGAHVPHGRVVSSIEDARELIDHLGYPVVMKPNVGVGAAHCYRIHNDEELRTFFYTQKPPDREYICEEFINGRMVTFDGMVDRSGNICFYASAEYTEGVMDVVHKQGESSYFILREVPHDVKDIGYKIVYAFGIRARFFHVEFFRTNDDGKLIALEANLRLPGGYTIDMWNYAHDIDLYKEYADMIAQRGERFTPVTAPHGHHHNPHIPIHNAKFFCCFTARRAGRDYAHSHEQIMDKYGFCVCLHVAMPPIFSPAMGDYAYIFRTSTWEQMHEVLNFIAQKPQ